MKYSAIHDDRTIVHFVGGKMTEDLKQNLDAIAYWVLDNDITILWGDDYQEEFNENHPVAALINRVKEIAEEQGKKPNIPIRILQIGEHYKIINDIAYKSTVAQNIELGQNYAEAISGRKLSTNLIPVYDEKNRIIGYHDNGVKDEIMIYAKQQQDRQKLYYNNADGLFVLPGGPGCTYEITNAFIYMNTGDLPKSFQIHILDNEDGSYLDYIKAYIKLTGNNPTAKKILLGNYYPDIKTFADKNLEDNDTDLV